MASSPPSIVRFVRAHSHLAYGLCVGALTAVLCPAAWSGWSRFLVAWDAGVLVYLVSTFVMMARASADDRRALALEQDAGALGVVLVALGSAVSSLVAIVVELTRRDVASPMHLVLSLATIVISWFFVHTIFAVHYAHEHERLREASPDDPSAGGLDFQTTEALEYFDFVYFAFVIGVAAQTADVVITRRTMRRMATLHGVFAFFFNTTIVALAVSLAASTA